VIGVSALAPAQPDDAHQARSVGTDIAIPSSTVKRLFPELIWGDLRATPWLGVTVEDYSGSKVAHGDSTSPNGQAEGAMLVDVLPGSPADDAQLQASRYINGRKSDDTLAQAGDVVTAIDGRKVNSAEDLTSYMARSGKQVGDIVTLRILRDGLVVDVAVRLRAQDGRQSDEDGAI
jgi:S1-C subfamily serine protease